MIKVLFVNARLTGGGSERAMTLLANEFAQMGIDTEMLVLRNDEVTYPVSEKVKLTNCFCPMRGNKSFWHIRRILTLRRAIKASGADIVVSFMWDTNMKVLLACTGLGKKVVISERNDPHHVPRKNSFRFACKWIFPRADLAVFQTPQARECYPVSVQRKSVIIPNPVIQATDRRWQIDQREKRIVAAGRFKEQKNFPMLLRAFDRFWKSHPDYTLAIYGKGELLGTLEALKSELVSRDSISFPGYSSNLGDCVLRSAIYVSSSNYEGISNSMLEALALGVPSVCTDCPVGGAAMVIRSGWNGILVPVGDEDAMVKALCDIADSDDYAQTLSKNAYEDCAKYSVSSIAQMWLEAIDMYCSKSFASI